MLVAYADRPLVDALAARADVARVDSNTADSLDRRLRKSQNSVSTQRNPTRLTAVEPGVTNVNAPAVWALGFTGQGMIVGNQDTGMRWDHNALKAKVSRLERRCRRPQFQLA